MNDQELLEYMNDSFLDASEANAYLHDLIATQDTSAKLGGG